MGLLLFAFIAPPAAQADELTVANGTSTNAYAPVHSSYLDGVGSTYQVIYPATELADLSGSNITGVKFYASGNLNFTGGSLQVSVGETTNATFSSATPITGLDVVATTEVSSTNNEFVLNFDNEYPYSGGNLVIEIKVLSAVTLNGYSAMDWYGVSATGNNVYHADAGYGGSTGTKSWLPKATFTYEVASTEPYAAKVTPSELAFGGIAVGGTKSMDVTLKNTGVNAFTPSVSVSGTGFSTTYSAAELASKASVTIPVTFNPATAGDFTGTLTINCGQAGTFTVELTGSAAMEKTICEGNQTNEFVPIYGYYYDNKQVNQIIYPASMLTDLVGKNIKSVTFEASSQVYSGGKYNVSVGTTEQTEFEEPIRLTGLTTVATDRVAAAGGTKFTITFDQAYPYTGGNLVIDFEVTEKGSYGGGHSYYKGVNTTNYPAFNSYGSSLNSNGVYGTKQLRQFLPQVTFSYEDSETPATPVITVDPATVDAFSTVVGTPVSKTVNVTGENLTGDITATVSGENADCFTAALENGKLTITYNPTAAGNHTATVTLSSTGAQDVTIALNGTATEAQPYAVTVNPENGYDFGNVLVDNTKVWTITVTNNGTQAVTPTLNGIEAPFSTTYTATTLAAGESATISINYAPTELGEHSNTITISFPEAGEAIAAYTFELTGKGVNSFEPTAENEVVKLITVDKRSIYVPDFVDEANGNTTPQQLNCYDMRFKMAQPDDPAKRIKAGDLHPGNNLYEFYAIDDFGTEFRFATINLYAEGQPSSNPSVSAMDAPIKVTPSVEYYSEDGMPVHPTYSHNTTLNYNEKIYNDINELVDLEGVIDYVNDTWSANTATNAHPDHYKFQIRGVGQYGDLITSLTAEYVESHMTGYGGSLVDPEGWDRGAVVVPNTETDGIKTYYFYDVYIKRSFFDERGITGPVTVVVNTTLSGSGYNADNYKSIEVNGVEQIIAKEAFKDYTWTVPLVADTIKDRPVAQVPMGVVIRLTSQAADFNRAQYINIYGGGTGVSNIDTVGIYKSSMNVKAYTQKQADEDTDRGLVAMNAGAKTDVNVLAYGDPAVTGYVLHKNTSASTTGMTQVASANHEIGDGVHRYVVNSTGTYNGSYNFVRDESLGNIDGMWLNMYPASENEYYLPVTIANGVGDDGVVRSENNTYGSAMQQVEKNGSVDFASSSKCIKSDYTWVKDGVEYAIYNPVVDLTSTLPAETGYQLYNYRLWVDYDDNEPAWDYDQNLQFIGKMDRPLYSGTETHIGATGQSGQKDECAFAAPNNLEQVKLVARFYYKKTSTSTLKARPTDKDRLYYVVENQLTIPMSQIVTGVEDVTNKAVAGVMYYNLAGMQSEEPFSGVNIVVTRYTDGSISTAKVLK